MPDRRIIAIAVSPRAYDEILKLKGKVTWTRWAVEMALLEHPDNETLKTELASLPKHEPKDKKEKKTKAENEEALKNEGGMTPELTEERKHLIAQLKGRIAHKTGKEREEAYNAYWEAKHGKPC